MPPDRLPSDEFDWAQQAREIRSARIFAGCVCAALAVVGAAKIAGFW